MPYEAWLHSHISAWAIGLILFIVALTLVKLDVLKGAKIIQMILRLFYILIIVTGIGLLHQVGYPVSHVIKGFLALVLIFSMEKILVRSSKRLLDAKTRNVFGSILIVSLVLIFLLGYKVI